MAIDSTVELTKKRLGRRLVRVREEAKIKQRELAERIVARTTRSKRGSGEWHKDVVSMQRNLRRYENGHNMPRGDMLNVIADELGVDPRSLTADGDDDDEDPAVRIRRIAAELILRGDDPLAAELLAIARETHLSATAPEVPA